LVKGLTVSEINTALKQAVDQKITTVNNSELKQVVQTKKSSTFWSILIKWIKNLLIAGCFAFTAYKLLIKKYFLNQSKKSPNQCIQESLNEMKNSINSLKSTMESINESIKHLKNNVIIKLLLYIYIKINYFIFKSANDETSTIKTELQSVKNLLLNRSQFPQLPNPTPILPSWQLVEKNVKKKYMFFIHFFC